jgi:hypothetical protein
MTIWASRHREALLRFKRREWSRLVAELGHRGRGRRESGAFLLAKRRTDRRQVTKVVYLDDLDPNCMNGGIHFDGRAYSPLWDICDREGLVVVGDAHTHPGAWVEQSPIDEANPMVARVGHVALILPHFANRPVRTLDIGVHQYQGDAGWWSWMGVDAEKRIHVGWLM